MEYKLEEANIRHLHYAESICEMMAEAAKKRGTGIAKRTPEYLQEKMIQGNAIIALSNNHVVGFCYIESWQSQEYVAHSGLIVNEDFRKTGLARKIKSAVFELSRKAFPNAKIFGITTSPAVMKINTDLGYKPVAFSNLTSDSKFWDGCKSCTNYDILERTSKKMCLCTGMLCLPSTNQKKKNEKEKSITSI
ncbi:MAG: GNAT family N-acetyltransferase [Crocinitomicaceae bacterium]|nr:GNAT family N-acetyltransferase [Crocinitomicaceae bacterium]